MSPKIHTSSQLPASDPFEQAALRCLARRDRSEAHIKAYLSRLGASAAQIRRVIKQLKAHGYLNDEAYALRWARARLARRPIGPLRLEAELMGRGIDRTTATRTVHVVYDETNERDLVRALLRRKNATPALLRRYGFHEETIDACFNAAHEPLIDG